MPRISIIVPVRDQATYLAESLHSVFRQPYDDVEVIVVDDGSTDDVASAIGPWRDRVQLVRQDPIGVAAARNHGVSLATGELLAFHDADDLMEPRRLPLLVERLDAHPDVALAFGNGVMIDAAGTPGEAVIPARQARALVQRGVRIEDLLRRSLIYLQASLIRRAAFEELGGMQTIQHGSDWAFALRCVLHYPVTFVDRTVFRYRQHAASLTASKAVAAEAAVRVLRDFVAREPTLANRVSRRHIGRALARRLARLAARQLDAGDVRGARSALEEAATLVPLGLKYRWRLRRLGPSGAPS